MKELPILFSTPMVQALLEGRKTKTRRMRGLEEVNKHPDWYWLSGENYIDKKGRFCQKIFSDKGNKIVVCPYGQPGDLLWVMESWRIVAWDFEDGQALVEYKNGDKEWQFYPDAKDDSDWLIKHVDYLENIGCIKQDEEHFVRTNKPIPFKPSIHMPKTFCRIFLRITNIRVERLQDITEADSIAEGIEDLTFGENLSFKDYLHNKHPLTPIASFKSLIESLNGIRSWEANPWVWVVSFEVVSKTGRPEIATENLQLSR